MSSNTKQRPQLPVTKPVTVQPIPVQSPEVNPAPQVLNLNSGESVANIQQSIMVDLGLTDLIEINEEIAKAYAPVHAQIALSDTAKIAIKRLSLTLSSKGAKLSNGKVCDTSVPFAVQWLCERFAESVKAT